MPSFAHVISAFEHSPIAVSKLEQRSKSFDDSESADELILKIKNKHVRDIVIYHFSPIGEFDRGLAIIAIVHLAYHIIDSWQLNRNDLMNMADLQQMLSEVADSLVDMSSNTALTGDWLGRYYAVKTTVHLALTEGINIMMREDE